jgi:hypothetical protein
VRGFGLRWAPDPAARILAATLRCADHPARPHRVISYEIGAHVVIATAESHP